ncbi:MAG: prepilin-type N-terminal cleavage/methylation domain-containing protein [Comamonadaceae bacterium]|nr:prepilin-type N-terminal cleavage/methylation domain-containing protein [Comamonadaceae bacterium]
MNVVLRNKKGVTLVELLAVIIIMGIIAAIAVPAISGLINRQKINAAEASYDLIVEVAVNYAQSESDNTVKISELVTAGYLEANPFTNDADLAISGSTVTFTVVGDLPDRRWLWVSELGVGTTTNPL